MKEIHVERSDINNRKKYGSLCRVSNAPYSTLPIYTWTGYLQIKPETKTNT